jgi:hypothetical protein
LVAEAAEVAFGRVGGNGFDDGGSGDSWRL